jgi:CoA:oxalate CoA-transferase
MGRILEDIRVLDLTHVVFGPWCTKMLAELGAEVIKIEPPWGALDRIPERGPMYGGTSASFQYVNLNKKDIAIDLKNQKGVKIFLELLKLSDVVVENFSPGTMQRLGLSYEEVKKVKPDIIYASLSGFGQTGPYSPRPSYAPIAEAVSGHTRQTGDGVNPNGPPINMAGTWGDVAPGTMAAMSIIAAIRYRDKTGVGQWIDVAQLDCMAAYNYNNITTYLLSGKNDAERRREQEKLEKRMGPAAITFGGLWRTRDGGYIQLAGMRAKGLDTLRQRMGVKELDREVLKRFVEGMTREEAVNYFVDVGLPVAPVLYASETVKDPQFIARNMLVEVDHPKLGRIKVMNFPVKFSETPGEVRTAAPLLGQHNREILKNYLGYSDEEIMQLLKEGVIASEK